MKHKKAAVILLAVSMVLLCATMITGALIWGTEPADGPEQPDQADQAAAPEGQDQSAPEGGADAPASTAKAAAAGQTVPEQDAPMGQAYFADAAFLGNEMTSGLWLYNNDGLLPSDASHWYCSDGLTVLAASPYAAQMPADAYGKVYIGFGINEVNYQRETVKAAFNTVLEQVQASQPNAIIYLMSVTPVSKYCDENRGYKRSSVQSFNRMLQDIAQEKGVWYLDVYPVLCGEDGYLPSDVTPDGINFSPAHYQKWFEYMQTHYVPDGTPPVPTAEPEPSEEPDAAE